MFRYVVSNYVFLEGEKIQYFDSKVILKYLNIPSFLLNIGIIEDIYGLIFKERKGLHTDCWSITISCLKILEKVLKKDSEEIVIRLIFLDYPSYNLLKHLENL